MLAGTILRNFGVTHEQIVNLAARIFFNLMDNVTQMLGSSIKLSAAIELKGAS